MGRTIDAIMDELASADLRVSRGAVAKYTKEWDSQDEAAKDNDRPFEWHRLEEYGLPWEAGCYLLEIWSLAKSRVLHEDSSDGERDVPFPEPTVREALWWWRVHKAVPEVGLGDVHQMARTFVDRELAHQLLKQPMYVADLEALLAWRPWEKGRKDAYYEAVERALIPAVHRNPFIGRHRLPRLAEDRELLRNTVYQMTGWPNPARPHLLPSQDLEEAKRFWERNEPS